MRRNRPDSTVGLCYLCYNKGIFMRFYFIGFVLMTLTLGWPREAEAPSIVLLPTLPEVVVTGDSLQRERGDRREKLALWMIQAGAPRQHARSWVGHFFAYGEDAGVDPITLVAMAAYESEFNPRATNPNDPSYGLLAIMPRFWKDSFVRECGTRATPSTLTNPRVNICYGAYIAAYFAQEHENIGRQITAYNNGTGIPNGYAKVVLGNRREILAQ